MKKFFIFVLVMIGLLVAINFTLGPILATKELGRRAETDFKVAGLKVRYGQGEVTRLFPLKMSLQKIRIEDPAGLLRVKIPVVELNGSLDWDDMPRPRFDFKLSVSRLSVYLAFSEKSEEASQKTAPTPTELPRPQIDPNLLPSWLDSDWFSLNLIGEFKKSFFRMSDSEGSPLFEIEPQLLQFYLSELLSELKSFQVKVGGDATVPFLGAQMKLPFEVKVPEASWQKGIVRWSDFQVRIAGIQAGLAGWMNLPVGSYDSTLRVTLADWSQWLSQATAANRSLKSWQGSLKGKARVFQGEQQRQPFLTSQFFTENLQGLIDFRDADLAIKGKLAPSISWDVNYSEKGWAAREVKLKLNADDLEMAKGRLFYKPKGAPFRASLQGFLKDNRFFFEIPQARLQQLKVGLKGALSLTEQESSKINLEVPKTNLQGMEKLFPALKTQPMQGSLAAEVTVIANLSQPEQPPSIEVRKLSLENFSTELNYESNGLQISGPLKAKLSGKSRTRGTQLKEATLQSQVNADQLRVSLDQVWEKKPGQKFSIAGDLQLIGRNLKLKKAQVLLGAGQLDVKGQIMNVLRAPSAVSTNAVPYVSDLALTIQSFPLEVFQTSSFWPEALSLKRARLAGKLRWRGPIPTGRVELESAPIIMTGELQTRIGSAAYLPAPSPTVSKEGMASKKTTEAPSSKLPDWPILKNSKVRWMGQIQDLQTPWVQMGLTKWSFAYAKKSLSWDLNAQDIFSGKVKVSGSKWSLDQFPVNWLAVGSFQGLQVGEMSRQVPAIDWAKFGGVLSGKMKLSLPWPDLNAAPEFIDAQGQVFLKSWELENFDWNRKLREGLQKIPGLQVNSNQNVKGVAGDISASYKYTGGNVTFDPIVLSSHRGDELEMKGTVSLGGEVDLQGRLAWKNPPFRGEVYDCNVDDKGRLELPVEVRAAFPAAYPQFPTNAISILRRKTLDCAQDKLRAKAKEKAKEIVEEKTEQLKKQIGSELEKKAKELFQ